MSFIPTAAQRQSKPLGAKRTISIRKIFVIPQECASAARTLNCAAMRIDVLLLDCVTRIQMHKIQ